MTYLFIVAHPDDEILGAGATIAKLKNQGHKVYVLTLSVSSKTRELNLIEKQNLSHEDFNIDGRYNYNLEAMKFSSVNRFEVTKFIESVMKDCKPDFLFIHHKNDIHNDHRISHDIALEAARLPQRLTDYNYPLKGIYSMEISSSTDWSYRNSFKPTCYSSINLDCLKKKVKALKYYDEVLRDIPHPRNYESIVSLARYRGGQCGYPYAEAFETIYSIL